MLSSCISLSSSVGMSSGPGAFLLFSFLIAFPISISVGWSVSYVSVFDGMIGVFIMFCVSASVLVPHCCSLRYLAASCALCLCCICCPCAFLL